MCSEYLHSLTRTMGPAFHTQLTWWQSPQDKVIWLWNAVTSYLPQFNYSWRVNYFRSRYLQQLGKLYAMASWSFLRPLLGICSKAFQKASAFINSFHFGNHKMLQALKKKNCCHLECKGDLDLHSCHVVPHVILSLSLQCWVLQIMG